MIYLMDGKTPCELSEDDVEMAQLLLEEAGYFTNPNWDAKLTVIQQFRANGFHAGKAVNIVTCAIMAPNLIGKRT